MKRAIWKILYGILCLGCIAAIFYPLVSNYLYDQRQDKIITDYTNDLAKADTEILQTELIACQEYNKKINQISTVVVDYAEHIAEMQQKLKDSAKRHILS